MPQELIVAGFAGTRRASEVLTELRQRERERTVDLEDAVAVHRTDDGQLRTDQSTHLTSGDGARRGIALGGLLGALLATPFTGGLSAAAAMTTLGVGAATGGMAGAVAGAGDTSSWKEEHGISDDVVTEVGDMIRPGDSAIFALIRSGNPDSVVEQFIRAGGRILRLMLGSRDARSAPDTSRDQTEPRAPGGS
jgi:uncharacterized membrane protein